MDNPKWDIVDWGFFTLLATIVVSSFSVLFVAWHSIP